MNKKLFRFITASIISISVIACNLPNNSTKSNSKLDSTLNKLSDSNTTYSEVVHDSDKLSKSISKDKNFFTRENKNSFKTLANHNDIECNPSGLATPEDCTCEDSPNTLPDTSLPLTPESMGALNNELDIAKSPEAQELEDFHSNLGKIHELENGVNQINEYLAQDKKDKAELEKQKNNPNAFSTQSVKNTNKDKASKDKSDPRPHDCKSTNPLDCFNSIDEKLAYLDKHIKFLEAKLVKEQTKQDELFNKIDTSYRPYLISTGKKIREAARALNAKLYPRVNLFSTSNHNKRMDRLELFFNSSKLDFDFYVSAKNTYEMSKAGSVIGREFYIFDDMVYLFIRDGLTNADPTKYNVLASLKKYTRQIEGHLKQYKKENKKLIEYINKLKAQINSQGFRVQAESQAVADYNAATNSKPCPVPSPSTSPSGSPSDEQTITSLSLSKDIISTKEKNSFSVNVTLKSNDNWELFLEGTTWQDSGTGPKSISIQDSTTLGNTLADGAYTFKLTNKTSSQTVTATLKVDNTKPEIESLDIKESDSANSLEIKLKDKLENAVSSGIDDSSIILETDGKKINSKDYTLANNLISYKIKKSANFDKLTIKYSDKVKNSDTIEIPVIQASVGTDGDVSTPSLAPFSIKATIVPSYLLGAPCTKIPYVVYLRKPQTSSLLAGIIGHSIVYTRGNVKVKNSVSYLFPSSYLPQYNGYASKEEWNGLTLLGSVGLSGRYKLQITSLLATYFPASFTYNFDQVTTFIFDGKSIDEVKSDSIKNVLNKKNIFDHIFQPKHRFDELIKNNPGLTETQIVSDVLDKIDFCTLKEGTFQSNYNGNYSLNLYGTTIRINNATWINKVFILADMYIPTEVTIPKNN